MKDSIKGEVLTYRLLKGKLFVKSPLTGWSRVEDYCTYISMFPTIYPTHKEAKRRGYEAHHVTPKSVQKAVYDEVTDDSCIRVTPFEHFIAHWLLAKECDEGESMLHYLGLGKLILCEESERRFIYKLCGDKWRGAYAIYLKTFELTGKKYMETRTPEELADLIIGLRGKTREEIIHWLETPVQDS